MVDYVTDSMAGTCHNFAAAVRAKIEAANSSHPCFQYWSAEPSGVAAAHAESLARAVPPDPYVCAALLAVAGLLGYWGYRRALWNYRNN